MPLPSSLSEPIAIENPFLEMSSFFHRSSPIDTMAAAVDPELLASGDGWEEGWKEEVFIQSLSFRITIRIE